MMHVLFNIDFLHHPPIIICCTSSFSPFWYWCVDCSEEAEIDEFEGGDGVCSGGGSPRKGTPQELARSEGLLCRCWAEAHSVRLHAQPQLAFSSPWPVCWWGSAWLEKKDEDCTWLCRGPPVSFYPIMHCLISNCVHLWSTDTSKIVWYEYLILIGYRK